jgi:hypothetical protein
MMDSDAVRMIPRSPRWLTALAVLALAGIALCPVEAMAQQPAPQDRETARTLMQEGDAKADAKNYSGALDAYRKAHAIMGVPTTGIEVARMLALLGQRAEAREVALSVAAMAPVPNEPQPFAEARIAAQKLADELAEPAVPIAPKVDATPRAAPVEVNPGEAAPAPSSKISPLVFAGFGVGAAGLIVGAVTGGIALSKAKDVHEVCPDNKCLYDNDRAQIQADNDTAHILANVSNVSLALGVVGVGVGIVGIFLSGGDKKSEPQAAALRVNVGAGYLGLSGAF